MRDWDVFVSYTHGDQAAASRVQAFVEDYPLPGGRRPLRVFRDKTDLRAGELQRSIPAEIRRARVLMLCCSRAAARSAWVSREVDAFHEAHGPDAPLVPLLLDGEPGAVVPALLRQRDALVLDLRDGWRLGRPCGATRVELLRAVAAAADVPLRELIPWDVSRRRRRWAITGLAIAAALAAVAIASTAAWMTQREASAAALRRDADTAALKIEAGDVAAGVAALGHALSRDERGLLTARAEMFRYWLDALPPAAETVRAQRGLFRMAGRIYARADGDRLVPLDLAEPFVAVAPWAGTIVGAGPGGISVFDAARGTRTADVPLPPGTRIMGLHQARRGDAFVALAQMASIENDEDKPEVPITCTALLLRGTPTSAASAALVLVRIATAEGQEVKPMQPLPGGSLFWHDCTPDRADAHAPADPAASPARDAPTRDIALDVPRLPGGGDATVLDRTTWGEPQRQAWPTAAPLPIVALPAVRPELTRWQAAGSAPSEFPKRPGTMPAMDDAAMAALGLDDVESGQRLFGEVVELAGFVQGDQRVFWSIDVCGNSWVCLVRCVAPASGKVSACKVDLGLSALQAWQVHSPDARRFAHLSNHMSEPPIAVVDIATYARRLPDRSPPSPVVGAAFTADGTLLVVHTLADQALVYTLQADGTPRYERTIGFGAGGADRPCTGPQTLGALTGSEMLALSGNCTVQRFDAATGALRWRVHPIVDGAAARAASEHAQLVVSRHGRTVLVWARGRARLVDTETGSSLSAALDPTELVPASSPDPPAIRFVRAPDGEPALDIGGQLFVRTAPMSLGVARRALPVLDRYTLISVADGRAMLQQPPPH